MSTENQASTKRINYIDFLKFIGITGIIIAHVGSPRWLMALRSFDVPFMVILSAVLAEKSYQKQKNNHMPVSQYYINRFKRLVFPTWIFLIFYFSVYFVIFGKLHSLKYYIASFLLTRYGIGYVWVILVYLYSALLIPLFSKIKTSGLGALCISAVYILYEVAYYFQIGVDNKLIDTTFYYIVPYGVLTYLGYNYFNLKKNHRYAIAAASFVLFAVLGIYYCGKAGSPQLVSIYKYPPRLYYLSFGVAVSFFLLILCENYNFKIYDNIVIRFISKNSLWIYLWHILTLNAYSHLNLPEIWYIKLVVVYTSAMMIVLLANMIINKMEKIKPCKIFKYLKG